MHITFGPSVEQLNSQNRTQLSEFLDELARSIARGYHRFAIGRSVGRWCQENLHEASVTRQRLLRSSEAYAQNRLEFDTARFKLQILVGDASPLEASPGFWEIGHLRVLDGSFLEPSCLVVEDATNDGAFFAYLLSVEAKRTEFGEISCHFANGGGSGLAKEFRRSIDLERITVCLADHDRLAPHGKRSQTNLRCQVVERSARGSYVGRFLELPCREVENFLPLDVISVCVPARLRLEHGRLRSVVDAQRAVADGDCLWLYFDVKMGFERDQIINTCKAPEAMNWIKDKWQCGTFDAAADLKIPGFGSDLPDIFLGNSHAKGEFFKFLKSDYWKKHFSEWLSFLLSFVAGAGRQRV